MAYAKYIEQSIGNRAQINSPTISIDANTWVAKILARLAVNPEKSLFRLLIFILMLHGIWHVNTGYAASLTTIPQKSPSTGGFANNLPHFRNSQAFLSFRASIPGWGLDEGVRVGKKIIQDFGLSHRTDYLDIQVGSSYLDKKYPARVEVPPIAGLEGEVTVFGIYFIDSPGLNEIQTSATVTIDPTGKVLTPPIFHRLDRIEAIGFTQNTELTVSIWKGSEQLLSMQGIIDGLSREECLGGKYQVTVNGSLGKLEWSKVSPFTSEMACKGYGKGYFPVLPFQETDNIAMPSDYFNWSGFINSVAHSVYFLTVSELDHGVRPLTMSLIDTEINKVIARKRNLYYLEETAFGDPFLTPQEPSAAIPDAFAQLSPLGLDQLEPLHTSVLPYPLGNEGERKRLSESFLQSPGRTKTTNLSFTIGDSKKWTNPDTKWAGSRAYHAIFNDIMARYLRYKIAKEACELIPDPIEQAACLLVNEITSCVKTRPRSSEFDVHVNSIYTEPSKLHPIDALTIDHVSNLNLSYSGDNINALLTLNDILGYIDGHIDPSAVSVKYSGGSACAAIIPAEEVSNHLHGEEDPWFSCKEMTLFSPLAPSNTMEFSPMVYPSYKEGISIAWANNPFFTTVLPIATATSTCLESWLVNDAQLAVLDWHNTFDELISNDWKLMPGQNEALERLLSPLNLGVETASSTSSLIQPYDVHPNPFYDLKAEIGSLAAETNLFGVYTNAGLYVPYISTAFTTEGFRANDFWLCPAQAGICNDGLYWRKPIEDAIDNKGNPFSIALVLTTAHLNHAMQAHVGHSERFGTSENPIESGKNLSDLLDIASAKGRTSVVDALSSLQEVGIRYYSAGVPFTRNTDFQKLLIYTVPNTVVELYDSYDPNQPVLARFVVDMADFNLKLDLNKTAEAMLAAKEGNLLKSMVSLDLFEDCFDRADSSGNPLELSCDSLLTNTVLDAIELQLKLRALAMVSSVFAPQMFDSAAEGNPAVTVHRRRHDYINQQLYMFGEFCSSTGTPCELQ